MRAFPLIAPLLASAMSFAAEPDRTKGLSVHMLPEQVAQISGTRGGFTVEAQTYADASELVDYFHSLPAATQENGIWVVTTDPSAYSAPEREKLRALIALCQQQEVPIFTCRFSVPSSEWKRSEVPSGWNSDAFVAATRDAPPPPTFGDVPLPECAAVFDRFSHLRLPADTKAVSRALGDSGWTSRAVIFQQTGLGGWIPIRSNLDPPGGVYVIRLSPPVSSNISGYTIYFHTTRAFAGDAPTGLQSFLAGRSAPNIRIDEYALCYPDNHYLLVDLRSRRITPPL